MLRCGFRCHRCRRRRRRSQTAGARKKKVSHRGIYQDVIECFSYSFQTRIEPFLIKIRLPDFRGSLVIEGYEPSRIKLQDAIR